VGVPGVNDWIRVRPKTDDEKDGGEGAEVVTQYNGLVFVSRLPLNRIRMRDSEWLASWPKGRTSGESSEKSAMEGTRVVPYMVKLMGYERTRHYLVHNISRRWETFYVDNCTNLIP